MKCVELLWALNEYVDGTVDPGMCEEFKRHIAGCSPCRLVVDNVRQTITLYRADELLGLPVRFREQLHAAIRRGWNDTHLPQCPDDGPVRL